MRRILPIAVLMGLSIPLSSCLGHECTLMDAPDNLEVRFEPPLSATGAWEISIRGDLSASCAVVLPVADPSDLEADPCGDSNLVSLDFSEDGSSITALTFFRAAPASLELSVSHEGTGLLETVITPEYEIDEPNGEGCGERKSASIRISVPAP